MNLYPANKGDLINFIRIKADISLPTISARDLIKTNVRKWGVLVAVYNDPIPENIGL